MAKGIATKRDTNDENNGVHLVCDTCRWWKKGLDKRYLRNASGLSRDMEIAEFAGGGSEFGFKGYCHFMPAVTLKWSSDYCGQWAAR
jgi:hypothetical protein